MEEWKWYDKDKSQAVVRMYVSKKCWYCAFFSSSPLLENLMNFKERIRPFFTKKINSFHSIATHFYFVTATALQTKGANTWLHFLDYCLCVSISILMYMISGLNFSKKNSLPQDYPCQVFPLLFYFYDFFSSSSSTRLTKKILRLRITKF